MLKTVSSHLAMRQESHSLLSACPVFDASPDTQQVTQFGDLPLASLVHATQRHEQSEFGMYLS